MSIILPSSNLGFIWPVICGSLLNQIKVAGQFQLIIYFWKWVSIIRFCSGFISLGFIITGRPIQYYWLGRENCIKLLIGFKAGRGKLTGTWLRLRFFSLRNCRKGSPRLLQPVALYLSIKKVQLSTINSITWELHTKFLWEYLEIKQALAGVFLALLDPVELAGVVGDVVGERTHQLLAVIEDESLADYLSMENTWLLASRVQQPMDWNSGTGRLGFTFFLSLLRRICY